jgi:hypothetical protein
MFARIKEEYLNYRFRVSENKYWWNEECKEREGRNTMRRVKKKRNVTGVGRWKNRKFELV